MALCGVRGGVGVVWVWWVGLVVWRVCQRLLGELPHAPLPPPRALQEEEEKEEEHALFVRVVCVLRVCVGAKAHTWKKSPDLPTQSKLDSSPTNPPTTHTTPTGAHTQMRPPPPTFLAAPLLLLRAAARRPRTLPPPLVCLTPPPCRTLAGHSKWAKIKRSKGSNDGASASPPTHPFMHACMLPLAHLFNPPSTSLK